MLLEMLVALGGSVGVEALRLVVLSLLRLLLHHVNGLAQLLHLLYKNFIHTLSLDLTIRLASLVDVTLAARVLLSSSTLRLCSRMV